jgi:hypothetical protein
VHTIRLLYSSEAAAGPQYRDLVDLLTHAQTHNRAQDITGILCYGSGQFLQALEGGRAAVSALYNRIAADPRHESCQVISVEEIATRDFADWSMKVVDWSNGQASARAAREESDEFNPRDMTASQALTFLRHLADLERELAD